MFCIIPQRKFSEFSSSLDEATIQQRIPYMGILELTHRCNLACCHCYCNLNLNDRRREEELRLPEIKRILDEIAEAGCFWLLLTGGEVLIREDFRDIYLYALKKGILTEIFTNATLITEETAKLFAQFPPLGIEITIYGSKPKIHEQITGLKDSFSQALEGINRLLKYKVPFSLKTMVINLNFADLKNMQKLAGDLGAEFKFDCHINPRIDGRDSPFKYRLPLETIVDLELEGEKNFLAYKEVFQKFWGRGLKDSFICTAGINSFNINPYGMLSPCTLFFSFKYSLRVMPFRDAWKRLVEDYGMGPNEYIYPECKACNMVLICPRCPAWAEIETKRLSGKLEYLCEYALFLEKKFFEREKEEARYAEKTLPEAPA